MTIYVEHCGLVNTRGTHYKWWETFVFAEASNVKPPIQIRRWGNLNNTFSASGTIKRFYEHPGKMINKKLADGYEKRASCRFRWDPPSEYRTGPAGSIRLEDIDPLHDRQLRNAASKSERAKDVNILVHPHDFPKRYQVAGLWSFYKEFPASPNSQQVLPPR